MHVPDKRPISMYHTKKGQYLHVCTTVKGQYLCITPGKANIYVPHQERPISKGQYLYMYVCTKPGKANIYINMYVPNQERPISSCMYHSKRPISMYYTKKGQYLCTTPRKANIYIYAPQKERPIYIYVPVPQEEKPISMYH